MTQRGHIAIAAILLVAGCAYNSRERVDQSVSALTCHPYDQQPPAPAMESTGCMLPPAASPAMPPPNQGAATLPRQAMDVRTVAWLESGPVAQAKRRRSTHGRPGRGVWT